MAVKVTGLFKTPNNFIFENPLLVLHPTLYYKGIVFLEITITLPIDGYYNVNNRAYSITIGQVNIESLSFGVKELPYDDLINALEDYVITTQQNSNEINSQSTFEKFTPE